MNPTIRTETIDSVACSLRAPCRFALVAGGSVQRITKRAGRVIFVSFKSADAFRAWSIKCENYARIAAVSGTSAFMHAEG